MIIELATLPPELQQYIAKVEQGESISFAKNGEPLIALQLISQPKQSAYDLIMSQDYPDVSDIELNVESRQLPTATRLEIFE